MAQGRYTIVGKLADGGMAEIFLARQHGAEGFEKAVVLKRILSGFSADPQFRNMFIDEAHISMGLAHSNIVHVLDLGVGEGRLFLVLELVDGWDLEYVLERADGAMMPLPASHALYVIGEVLRGLAYAHARRRGDGTPMGIVHRDVSPNNVLLSAQGEVKLADFGIAKAATKRERTAAGIIKGKVGFMSPEQASGLSLDARSDIYSVGTVLYTLMTGRKPFHAASDLESILKVQRNEYRPPREVNDKISFEVGNLITRAMRLHPAERYQRAEDMLADVEKVLRSEFQSVGQTELKRWLDELGRQDGILPFGEMQMSGVMPARAAKAEGSDLGAGTQIVLTSADKVTGEAATTLQDGATPPPLPLTPRPSGITPPTGRAGVSSELLAVSTPPPAPETGLPSFTPLSAPPLLALRPPKSRRMGGAWGLALALLLVVVGLFAALRPLARWAGRERELSSFRRRLGHIAAGDDADDGKAGKNNDDGKAGPNKSPEVTAPALPEATGPGSAPAPAPGNSKPVPVPSEPGSPSAVTPPGTSPVAANPVTTPDKGALPETETTLGAVPRKAEDAPTVVADADGQRTDNEDDDDEEKLSQQLPAHPAEVVDESEGAATPGKSKGKGTPSAVSLHLVSNPSGAIVKVGKRVLGRTPLNLRFRSQSSYELVFVKAGFQTTTRRLAVTSKSKGLSVALPKAKPAKKKSLLHR